MTVRTYKIAAARAAWILFLLIALDLFAPGGGYAAAAPKDPMSYLDNGRIRIGVDLGLGGAITYLSRSGSTVNLVNSADWGRQIQMSDYSGPVPFAPRGKQPSPAWAGLGWNPIQSGDAYGHRSRVLWHTNDGRRMVTKCVPMQWPLDNEPGECTFETWIELQGSTVSVRCQLNNARSDKTQYPARGQELPAVYTNGPWYRLLTYTGDAPFTNGALTTIPPVFPWRGWEATENWAALVDANDFGLGIWEPGVYSFIGGFAGKPGAGGPHDNPTGYIAPVQTDIIDYNIVYTYRYVLIVGDLQEIRKTVYRLSQQPAPPFYRFTTDRQHWYTVNAVDTGWPIHGELDVALDRDDPQLIGPAAFWHASDAPVLSIDAAFHTGAEEAQVFWKRRGDPDFSQACSVTFPVLPDGRFHTYKVNLSASPEYRGIITGLRFDPVPSGKPGDSMRLKSIGFRKNG